MNKTNAPAFDTRPGPGWKHLSGPVWEHTTGARIHIMGLVRLPGRKYYWLDNWKHNELGRLLIQINGGNRKRGLMAWAVNLAGK